MTAETPFEKACRYLAEGRLTVARRDRDTVDALCRGSGQSSYAVTWLRDGGWTCTCPARVARCSHIVAADLVTQPHIDWGSPRAEDVAPPT